MTDPLGQSQVLPYLQGLASKGFHITLVSFEKRQRYASTGKSIHDRCQKSGIEWHPLSYTSFPPVLSTLKDLFLLWKRVFDLHKAGAFDIVHARSYLTALIALRLKKRFGVSFLFDMRGFWADERIEGGIWSLSNPLYALIYRYFKKKERQFLRKADHVIVLTEAAREVIDTWDISGSVKKNLSVIPCCVDLEIFDSPSIDQVRRIELRSKLVIEESSIILNYIGSLGSWYMLDEMIRFFGRWILKYPDSIFLFITPDDPSMVHREAARQGIPPDRFRICRAERSEIPLYLSLCDASVFFIRPSFSKKASSPTKLGELMAMGIPVIANKGIGDVDGIIKKWRAGVFVDSFSHNSYDIAVEEFSNTNFKRDQIIEGAASLFSLLEGVRKYSKVYDSLINERSAS